MDYRTARTRYFRHKNRCADCNPKYDAAGNRVEFRLSFEAWANIWLDSGHWRDYGTGRGKYCMARHNDLGHYEVGNVSIIPHTQNVVDASVGRTFTHTQDAKDKISAAQLGKRHSPEHCAAISKALTGAKVSEETKAKLSAMNKGKPMKRVQCPHCDFETSPQNMSRHIKSRHGEGYSTAKLGTKQT